jgi:hypothetical protein
MSAPLKARLLNVMKRELLAQELQLSPYCERQIRVLVNHGITRMRISKVLEKPSHIMRAEQNMKSLVRYFYKHSKEVGTFPILRDSAFNTALNNCPTLWPFRS